MIPLSFRSTCIAISDISEYGYLVIGLICLVAGWKSLLMKLVSYFLICSGILYITSIYLAENSINSIPIYHLIGLLELTFGIMVYRFLGISKKWDGIFVLAIGCYILNSLFFQSIFQMNSYAAASTQLLILIMGINFLYRNYSGTVSASKLQFTVNSGFIVYAASALFVLLMSSKIFAAEDGENLKNMWIIQVIAGALRLLIFLFAIKFVHNDQ